MGYGLSRDSWPYGSGSFLWMKQHKGWFLPSPGSHRCAVFLIYYCLCASGPNPLINQYKCLARTPKCHQGNTGCNKASLLQSQGHLKCILTRADAHTTSTVTYCTQPSNKYCCIDSTVIYPAESQSPTSHSTSKFFHKEMPSGKLFLPWKFRL